MSTGLIWIAIANDDRAYQHFFIGGLLMQHEKTSINPLDELIKAIALTGTINNLSRLSGIDRSALTNIFKQKFKTNISTILRLKSFVEQHINKGETR